LAPRARDQDLGGGVLERDLRWARRGDLVSGEGQPVAAVQLAEAARPAAAGVLIVME
jgi:hypothetical protein